MAIQDYALKYGKTTDDLPSDAKVVIEQHTFWDGLKDVVILLRPLVPAQSEAEYDECTLGDIGVCFGDIYAAFSNHPVPEERPILLEKLERRGKWFYQPELMVCLDVFQPQYQARNLMKVDLVTGVCAVKMQLHEERKERAKTAKDTTKHGKSALSKTEDGVLGVIQTAGLATNQEVEGESQVDAEISAISTQFDEFLTDVMKDELTDDDDEMVVPVSTGFRTLKYLFGYDSPATM
ncbi:hypothetical protein RvY_15257 [Ramazzottius varieornatus]|uniref:Uncharacterized protein n=1 Tax=Ramazzottius varieornatus TaxID=947166 RepID=A0A1D1VU79_RAMVA|nr:hypothetical protein RvY_15257 [Ramazzottius varieornatus]